jgi:hypothetical protein
MTSRIVTNESERDGLFRLLSARDMPFTVAIKQGKHRTNDQNRLQRLWINQATEQLGDESAEEKRGYCKLHFGVPILRNADDAFCAEYDSIIKPLPYENKLKLMQVPFDFRVTSLMNTKQKKEYLDAIHKHFTAQGVHLTDPEGRGSNHGGPFRRQ